MIAVETTDKTTTDQDASKKTCSVAIEGVSDQRLRDITSTGEATFVEAETHSQELTKRIQKLRYFTEDYSERATELATGLKQSLVQIQQAVIYAWSELQVLDDLMGRLIHQATLDDPTAVKSPVTPVPAQAPRSDVKAIYVPAELPKPTLAQAKLTLGTKLQDLATSSQELLRRGTDLGQHVEKQQLNVRQRLELRDRNWVLKRTQRDLASCVDVSFRPHQPVCWRQADDLGMAHKGLLVSAPDSDSVERLQRKDIPLKAQNELFWKELYDQVIRESTDEAMIRLRDEEISVDLGTDRRISIALVKQDEGKESFFSLLFQCMLLKRTPSMLTRALAATRFFVVVTKLRGIAYCLRQMCRTWMDVSFSSDLVSENGSTSAVVGLHFDNERTLKILYSGTLQRLEYVGMTSCENLITVSNIASLKELILQDMATIARQAVIEASKRMSRKNIVKIMDIDEAIPPESMSHRRQVYLVTTASRNGLTLKFVSAIGAEEMPEVAIAGDVPGQQWKLIFDVEGGPDQEWWGSLGSSISFGTKIMSEVRRRLFCSVL